MRLPHILSLTAICGLLVHIAPAYAAAYPDTAGTPFDRAFAFLTEQGAVEGYPDGRVRPERPLNRAEGLKMLLSVRETYGDRIERYASNMPSLPLFDDVRQQDWFAPYVEVAFEEGIVTGYPDESFRPDSHLSTEEAVAMLLRAYGRTDGDGNRRARLSPHIENTSHAWYTPYINEAIRRNLVMERGRLQLGEPVTRGRFADMLYRLETIRRDGTVAYGGPEPAQQQNDSLPRQEEQRNGQRSVAASNHPYASEQYFAISMPSLGVEDLTVTHPEDAVSQDGVLAPLEHGVGHLFAYPGSDGKIMIYGHSSSYPWDVSQYTKIFRRVNELETGDRIYVTYDGTLHVYEVTREQTVPASDTSAFKDDGSGEELILYTCWPPDSIAERYLVHAVPVDTVALR